MIWTETMDPQWVEAHPTCCGTYVAGTWEAVLQKPCYKYRRNPNFSAINPKPLSGICWNSREWVSEWVSSWEGQREMGSDSEAERSAHKEKEKKKLSALAPIAKPLAGKKLCKRTLKLIRRGRWFFFFFGLI